MIDVREDHYKIILGILKAHAPDCEVRAFGSRVNGTAKSYSDLDIAIAGKKKLDPRLIEKIKDDFAESDIPFRVDVLDWNSISRKFQKVIERGYEVIQKATKSKK